MSQMIPFNYGGFWDVPRYIVVHYRGRFILLQSEFNDELDEYEASYSVYVIPDSVGNLVREGNWDAYNRALVDHMGEIPVESVSFDQSKRKELDPSCLDRLIDLYDAG